MSSGTIAKLNGTFAIEAIRRLSPVLPVLSRKNARVPFTTCADMLLHDQGRNMPLWKLVVWNTDGRAVSGRVIAQMVDIALHPCVGP